MGPAAIWILIGLRLLQSDHVISVIELDEQLAGVDVIILTDVHRLHIPANLRQHGHDVAVDLGVVGGLVRAAVAHFLENPEKNQ